MIIRTKKKKKTANRIVTVTVLTVVIAATYLFGRFMPREWADVYSAEIFPLLSSLPQRLSSLTKISVTEITVITFGILIIPLLILWLVLLIRKALTCGAGDYLYKSLRNVLVIAMAGLILFELLHGFNYRRTPARAMLGLGYGKLTFEDYCEALEWSYEGMIKARKELEEDEHGVAKMTTDFEGTSEYASRVVDSFCLTYGISRYACSTRAKSVRLSHYWSWTYIVGMYNPVYGEANINTDFADTTALPVTVCHELCHAKGFANETDCNLVGAFACVISERADFRYCGYYTIFISLLGQIDKLVKTKGFKYDYPINNADIRPVARDMKASQEYWKSVDAEVLEMQKRLGINITEKSLETNNRFLESNGEKGGNETYNVPGNEYVDFYLKYFSGKGNKDA